MLTKIIPCVLLTFVSIKLIRVLIEANQRKQRLMNSNNLNNASTAAKSAANNLIASHNSSTNQPPALKHSASQQQGDRTTKMLIAVLLMFLVCEFPSGIIALLSGIFGEVFFLNVYNNFGEVMDIFALINSGVNFILYCCMSHQFRKTFQRLFLCQEALNARGTSYTIANTQLTTSV